MMGFKTKNEIGLNYGFNPYSMLIT